MYYTEHHKIIEKLLRTCEIFVACNDKDPGELYGWACGETRDNIFVLHYIYVKHTFRMIGVGKLILGQFAHNPEHAAIYTHHTKYADRLADKFRMFHNPYIALTEEYRGQKEEESKNESKSE